MSTHVNSNNDIILRGRVVGWVHQGLSGEWFGVPNSRRALAHPVESAENIKGQGFRTAQEAAEDFVAGILAREAAEERRETERSEREAQEHWARM